MLKDNKTRDTWPRLVSCKLFYMMMMMSEVVQGYKLRVCCWSSPHNCMYIRCLVTSKAGIHHGETIK